MTDTRLAHPAGFSLLEMLIVMALIALMSAFALPSITSYFQVSLSKASREMASTVKEAYNSTIITGKVHRLVLDFKSGTYWVESGPADALLDTRESLEKAERRKRWAKPSDKPPPSNFAMESSVTRKKMALPEGVEVEDVYTERSPDPMTEGTAYSHMFPSGITEQTIIHLKDKSEHHNTLVITPLLGRTDVYERYASKNEIFKN
jgi:prepilin-type N-terminal cleavage/methylation domain-containing protein